METANTFPLDRMLTDDGQTIRVCAVDIPAWNMDAFATKSVPIVPPIPIEKIMGVNGVIWNDTKTSMYFIISNSHIEASLDQNISVDESFPGSINLLRRLGGRFDGPGFNTLGTARGRLYVWYLE